MRTEYSIAQILLMWNKCFKSCNATAIDTYKKVSKKLCLHLWIENQLNYLKNKKSWKVCP